MLRNAIFRGSLVVSACVSLTCAGCTASSTSTRTSHTISRGDLDEFWEIRLSYDEVRDRTGWEPEHRYEQLTLEVSPREAFASRYTLKTVDRNRGTAPDQCNFTDVKGRTDQSRQKIWFVERFTGRIVATLDRTTGKATGPDDPSPPWATPNGGVPLKVSE